MIKVAIVNSVFFLVLFTSNAFAQDIEVSDTLPKKRGVFTIGIHPNIIFNSYEGFSPLGNEAVLTKRNFASTTSYDKNGDRTRGIRNVSFGVSLLYRVINKQGNSWGVGLGFSQENTAFKHTNLETFNYPTSSFGGTVNAWINWYTTQRYSINLQRAWGKKSEAKWNAKWVMKLKTSFMRLKSVNSQPENYTEEWLNENNTGGIWEGTFLRRNNICFMPEIGRQVLLGESGKILFQVGIGYQFCLYDMYELKYYNVNSNTRRESNQITINGNHLALNFSLHVPIITRAIAPIKKSKVKGPKEEIPRQYSQNNLVFLLDVSVSMDEDGKLELLKEYMTTMLDSLPPYDYITIITFSGATKVVLKPTQVIDKEDIIDKLEKIVPKGGTNVNKGLKKAYDVLRKNYISKGNNRIIIATDGVFRATGKTKQRVQEALAQKDIKLSVFHFVGDRFTASLPLKELAAIGGGNYALVNEANITDKLQEEYKQKVD